MKIAGHPSSIRQIPQFLPYPGIEQANPPNKLRFLGRLPGNHQHDPLFRGGIEGGEKISRVRGEALFSCQSLLKSNKSTKINSCHLIHLETAQESYERDPPGRKINFGTNISTLFRYAFTDRW